MRPRIRAAALRHAPFVAGAVLALTVVGFTAAMLVRRSVSSSGGLDEFDLLQSLCQLLPYGVVGAVLVARRPDLPFGWLLCLGAVAMVVELVAVGGSYAALERGHGGQLAAWGLSLNALGFLPLALQGLVNVRFPTGSPQGSFGRRLERALVVGTVVALAGGILNDSTTHREGVPAFVSRERRFIDGTVVTQIGDVMSAATPLVILLGVLAGVRIVVRCFRADGVERQQLQWRAAGVAVALVLFPLAVTESLPAGVDYLDPFVFVITLVVPVLRYDLWAIDSLIRRSAAYTLTSSGGAVQNLVRAVGEMLRLPYVAVLRDEVASASYGQATSSRLETWPLVDGSGPVGCLVAAPRHGADAISDADRQVLATVARLVTESVRAEGLTADLLQVRQQLVTAREEERRRLRRDLHDGLGPLLTGLGLNLDAARGSVGVDDGKASTYLGQAKDASSQVISDLRALVHDLRPPALDELGLAGAVRLHAERITRDAGLHLDLTADEGLALPAAVEVAGFRTAVEAVTNVVRHSDARTVAVVITRVEDRVRVEVTDDGTSPGPWQPGVGLASMRERAEELGGTFAAGPQGQGGRVLVEYPVEVGCR